MYELKEKVALITGAASGIGLACAKEFLRNKLKGVILVDVNSENGKKALDEIQRDFGNNSAIFVRADVGDKMQLEEAFEAAIKAFNQLDIVMNNAGIVQELNWEKCINVNIKSVIMGSTLAIDKYLPKYQSGPGAIVVNTSSSTAFEPMEAIPVYCATKSAVLGYTRAMGSDMRYENTKIRIVAVCPGLVDTPIVAISEKQASEPYLSRHIALCGQIASQTPQDMAQKVVKIITEATTGSAWLAIGKNCIQVDFPNVP